MSLDQPQSLEIDGSGLRFGIVAARFNQRLVDMLLNQVLQTLDAAGVAPEDIETLRVPGSNEVPYAIGMLASGFEFDCLIALGLVLAGDTSHHDMIAFGTSDILHRISRETETPVINGIITVNTMEQAEDRCGPKMNRGREFAHAALEMAEMKIHLVQRLDEIYGDPTKEGDQWKTPDDDDEHWRS